jgi:hypothetical protein
LQRWMDPGLGSGSSQLALQPSNCVRPTLPWVSILHPKLCNFSSTLRSNHRADNLCIASPFPHIAAIILECTQCIMLLCDRFVGWGESVCFTVCWKFCSSYMICKV